MSANQAQAAVPGDAVDGKMFPILVFQAFISRAVSESRQSSTEEVAHELFQNIEQFTKQVPVVKIAIVRIDLCLAILYFYVSQRSQICKCCKL